MRRKPQTIFEDEKKELSSDFEVVRIEATYEKADVSNVTMPIT